MMVVVKTIEKTSASDLKAMGSNPAERIYYSILDVKFMKIDGIWTYPKGGGTQIIQKAQNIVQIHYNL